MTTQQIADKYYELASKNQIDETFKELFSKEIISYEPQNRFGLPEKIKGIDELKSKHDLIESLIIEYHGGECSKPIVSDYHFSVVRSIDATLKNIGRFNKSQLVVFEVENDKIITETNFYRDDK